jgi:muramoyltetrapeptide carboxypeptidase LdcA involved in peptidoglycan recycling
MIIPAFLRKGQTIGVTAPSFGVVEPTDIARFDHAKKKLLERGYPVRETPNVHTADETGRSSPLMQRVMELGSLLEDDSVGAVVSASGGNYQCEMLMGMDWDFVERHPKWIQGYSDNTVLLFKTTVEHDIATIYAGNFGDFGMEPWHRSISENLEFLEGKRTEQSSFERYQDGFADRVTGLEPFNEELEVEWVCDRGDADFSGRLIGGCMDVLEWYHRKGNLDISVFTSRYAKDGIIWYMETYDMDEPRIRKMLEGMSKDGWFEGVSGFIFGRPLFYQGSDYQKTIEDCLREYDVPKVFGADVGHKGPRMTFVNGAFARISVRGKGATIGYDLDR